MTIKTMIPTKFLLSLSLIVSTFSCGTSPVKGLDQRTGFAFAGIPQSGVTMDSITGVYTLTWPHPTPNTGYYFIYKRFENEPFDFTKPWRVTRSFVESTSDLHFEPKSCFVVRFSLTAQGKQDTNTKEACTTHEQVRFNGIGSISREENSDYLIRWDDVPIPNVVYSVYTGTVEDRETVSFVKPAWETTENFLRIDKFELGRRMCFAVRFNGTNPIVDPNTNVKCTEDNLVTDFTGIESANSPEDSVAEISWLQSAATFVSGYTIHVYKGLEKREFKTTTISQLTNISCNPLPPEDSEMRPFCSDDGRVRGNGHISGLVAGGVYFFTVRAQDAGNHEDTNEKSICLKIVGDTGTESCP